MTNLLPTEDRLVIRRSDNTQTTTPGGLYIPENAKEKPVTGLVLAAGPGRINDAGLVPMMVKVGQTVLYGKYAGTEVTVDGDDLLILRETDVLAVVPPKV
jgi:chaperonin GroES